MPSLRAVLCIFRIHLARLRSEAGPFLLAALIFPTVMYLFTSAVKGGEGDNPNRLRFLAGSIVFSLSLTAISWLGYLLLENRFTGRLKLFATLPLAPSSYVFGILIFGILQATLGIGGLLFVVRLLGIPTQLDVLPLVAAALSTMLCFCGISVIIATLARSFSEGSLLTDSLGAGLVFLAPVYFPADAMPYALRIVAECLPTTLAARAIEQALSGTFALRDVALLCGMAALSLLIGFRLMRFREN